MEDHAIYLNGHAGHPNAEHAHPQEPQRNASSESVLRLRAAERIAQQHGENARLTHRQNELSEQMVQLRQQIHGQQQHLPDGAPGLGSIAIYSLMALILIGAEIVFLNETVAYGWNIEGFHGYLLAAGMVLLAVPVELWLSVWLLPHLSTQRRLNGRQNLFMAFVMLLVMGTFALLSEFRGILVVADLDASLQSILGMRPYFATALNVILGITFVLAAAISIGLVFELWQQCRRWTVIDERRQRQLQLGEEQANLQSEICRIQTLLQRPDYEEEILAELQAEQEQQTQQEPQAESNEESEAEAEEEFMPPQRLPEFPEAPHLEAANHLRLLQAQLLRTEPFPRQVNVHRRPRANAIQAQTPVPAETL